jgi:hypothetical protein
LSESTPNYEKSMFFLPNRLHVDGTDLFVSFNIAVIPVDMEITSAALYIPLPERAESVRVDMRVITGGWDEIEILTNVPAYRTVASVSDVGAEQSEIGLEVTHLVDDWRFNSLQNHGLFVKLRESDNVFFRDHTPPYLQLETV